MLEEKGAKRLTSIGEGDNADDFEYSQEAWEDSFWKDIMKAFHIEAAPKQTNKSQLSIEYVSEATETPIAKTYKAFEAEVITNKELHTESDKRSVRHIESRLPETETYQEGDHLGVLPQNSGELISRVIRLFGLDPNQHFKIKGRQSPHLPMDRPVNAPELLASYVEPQEPATRAQLRELAAHTVCPPHQKELEHLYSDDAAYKENVLKKRMTMLDLLEDYPACELPFERFFRTSAVLKGALLFNLKLTEGNQRGAQYHGRRCDGSGMERPWGIPGRGFELFSRITKKAIPPSVSSARRSRVSHCLKIRKRLSLWSEQAQELRRSGDLSRRGSPKKCPVTAWAKLIYTSAAGIQRKTICTKMNSTMRRKTALSPCIGRIPG